MAINLATEQYGDWKRLVFDHPVPPDPLQAAGAEWYWDVEIAVSEPARLVAHFTRMCLEMRQMQFAASQINQGLWMLLGERVNFGEYLVETTIPLDSRLQCLSAMKDVYSGYVAGFSGPVENVFLMWWHLIIASAGWGENLIVNDEDQHLRSQAFTVLTEILAIPDPVCQRCALHGLGHLGHPERPRVVDEWLTENRPLLTPDTTAWVEQCRDGSVM